MAQIKISELNELETIQDNDLFVVVDESEGETKKAKSKNVRAKNKPLIAVTDEEPTEFNEDDEYYNTETRLIYKAINSTTWSVEGKVPEEGIMYVVFPEKSTFAWDGSDLISVGGGSGSSDIIIIGDESETTEDTKLLVDTSGTTDTLKYKDNNSFTELQIKALDSMPVGTIVEFNGQASDIPSGWEEVSGKSYVAYELWTNPNPSSAFAEQTIQLDLSNYEAIEIVFSTLASGTTRQTFGKILVGYGAKYTTHDWIAGVGEALIFRALSTSTTGVSFNNAFDVKLSDGTIPSQVNDYLIPYQIIGYKEV